MCFYDGLAASLEYNSNMRKYTKCIVDDCTSAGHVINGVEYFTKGYCKKHYLRLIRYGDINYVKMVKGEDRGSDNRYSIYLKMKARCLTPNDGGYHHYGGRDIKVHDSWLGLDGFRNFCHDMGERPLGTSLDRIDVNGDYSPDNCRWATRNEQMRNTRRTKMLTKGGVTRPLADWADIMGVTQKSLWNRVLRGDSDERVLRPMVTKQELDSLL